MKKSLSILLLFQLVCLFAFSGTPEKGKKDKVAKTVLTKAEAIKEKFNHGEFSQGPSGFTENKGQIHDQNYEQRRDVLFGGTDGQLVFHLKNNGLSYQLSKIESWKEDTTEIFSQVRINKIPDQVIFYRIDVKWLGANANAEILKGSPLNGVNNYYTASCPNGALNVTTFEQITYQQIYSGIDLKWYYKNGQVKYDYIVEPGADYQNIKIEIKGAEKLSLNFNGELVIKTPLGEIVEAKPFVTQNGIELSSRWILKDDVVSFEIENVNNSQELIIDPSVRSWGTYYGGASDEDANDCITDASDNVYIVGNTNTIGGTSIATSGAHQTAHGGSGSFDGFLVKFNSSGVRQWGTYYGGPNSEWGQSCSTDASGNVYIAGTTLSQTGISTSGSHQQNYGFGMCGCQKDAFLVKFNSSGVRQWGTYYGGGEDDLGYGCTTDGSGNVFLTGITRSFTGTEIATGASHQSTFAGTDDAFLVMFNSSGVRQWGTYYGGTGFEWGYACASDASGNIYLVGQTASSGGTTIATSGSHDPNHNGGTDDGFVVKFNSSGVRQWGTYYGGTSYDRIFTCATDVSGNIFIAGVTASSNGTSIATAGCHQNTTSCCSSSSFLGKFNSSGVRQWGTYYGSDIAGAASDCSTDASGNVYMVGATASTINIASGGFQNSYGGGGNDAYLVKFNTSGVMQLGTYYGGSANDYGRGCAADPSGNIYLVGYTETNSGTSIASSGSHQSSFGGGTADAYIVKFGSTNVPLTPSAISGGATACSVGNITYSVTNDVNALSYTWSLPGGWSGTSTTNIISLLPGSSGVLSVVANNAFGSSPAQTLSVTVILSPIVNIVTSSVTVCSGANVTLTAGGAITYAWSGGPATAAYVTNPTITTIYTVTGTSAAGCTNTAVQTISVISAPVLTITPASTVICSGNTTTLTGSGASTYTWSGGPSTASFAVSPTVTTIYTLAATSAAGCTNTASQSVSVNTTPTLIITPSSTVICSGQTATLTASGASTYTWSGGPATAAYAVSPTVTTIYTVSGTSSGCTNTAVQSLSVNTTPSLSISTTGSVICSGFNTTLTASGAASYTWNAGPSTASYAVNPVVTTIYTVIGTAANSCTNSSIQTVSVNTTPNLTITPSSTVICFGKSATITASGAGSYTWSGGPSTASFVVSPTITTSYTVTGGSAGCTNTAVQSISVITTPTVSISSTGTIICSGLTTTLTGNGANTYVWSAGPATADHAVSPVSNTNYTVTGTAVNGCTASAVQQVSVNASPVITITPSSTVICSGKSATLTASGANTFTWTSGPASAVNVVSPSVTTIYTVTGTTAVSGCTSIAVRNISVNLTPTITISPSSTVLCLGKTALLTGLGGNSYTWTGGPTTDTYAVTPTITTVYTVTGVTAASGCTNTAVQNMSVNALTAINITPAAPVICSGNTSTLVASGVTSYSWIAGPVTASYAVTPSVTTAYSVTGTDAATGCTNIAMATVSVNTTPTLSVNSGSICSGTSFTIVPTGASTYTISGGTTTVSPMSTSAYTVTGTSAAGCPAINTVVASVSVFITPTVSVNSGSICTGNSFTMTPSGAATYTYSSGSNIVSPMTSTNYSVTGSSTAGCISVNTAVSNVTVNITPTLAVNSGTLCTGLTFTLVPTGASTYTFSSGAATVNPLVTTSYSVTGTSAAGCIANNTAVSTVTVYITPTVSANSGSICTGNNFTIVPSGASTYTISGSGAFIVSPTAFTSYSIIGTSVDGCQSANTATSGVTAYLTPTITIVPTPANAIICTGEYAWMAANGASTYTWLAGGPASQAYTVSPLSNASYTVIGTSGSSGCTNTAVQNLTVNTTPTVTIVPSSTLICSGNTTTLSASGTNSYTWSPTVSNFSSTVFSPTATTMYTVIGTAVNNCTAMAMQSVSVNITPTLSINPSNTVICSGNSATFTAAGAASYLWNTSAATASVVLSPTTNTSYTVTGTTNNCSNTAVQSLSVNVTPSITIVPSTTVICSGRTSTLTANGANTYTWNISALSSSVSVSPSVSTSYTVTGTSATGNCTNSAIQSVSVNLTPSITISPSSTLICTGKTATFTASGANTYSWSNFVSGTSILISPSVSTSYTVIGTNSASGCTNTASQSLSVNTTPNINLVQTSTVICSGRSVTITLSGANTYSWNTGATNSTIIFNPSASTNYSVIGFATNNCTNSAATSISVNTTPTVSVNSGSICSGESFVINPSGASTYTISGGTTTVSPLTNTMYLVSGTSTNGCVSSNTPAANVVVNPLPLTTVNSGSICIGFSFTLAANGASSYTWNSGANTSSIVVSPSVPTIYTVTGANTFNCIKTVTASVAALVVPNVSISGNTAVCIGSTTTLTANGATNFTWNPGAQTSSVIVVSPTVNTTYSVRGVLGSNSCSNTAVQLITINPKPILSISGNSFVCPGSPLILTANGAVTYTWTGGLVSNTINVTPTITTNYSVSGSDANGCSNTTSYQVKTASMITPSLCLVTVDSLSINNEIYWDKTLFPRADTFLVYREYIATQYAVIARIPRSAYSAYVDTNRSIGPNIGNPNHSSYKYKLQYKDSCGNLSAMSPYHKTIKIDDFQTGNFTWNYYNIDGIDYQLANYYLYRYHVVTGSLTSLGGTSGNSFTDPLYSSIAISGNYKWYVSTTGFVCNPSQKPNGTTAGKNGTKSNNSNERQFPTPEGVDENLLSENKFVIYPNPAHERFVLNSESLEDFEVELIDLLGRVIFVPVIREKTSVIFEIAHLKQGMYLIRITRGKEQLVKKVVVE